MDSKQFIEDMTKLENFNERLTEFNLHLAALEGYRDGGRKAYMYLQSVVLGQQSVLTKYLLNHPVLFEKVEEIQQQLERFQQESEVFDVDCKLKLQKLIDDFQAANNR